MQTTLTFHPGRMTLLVAPSADAGPLFDLLARFSLQTPLYVLDGGNSFQGYELARRLRRYTVEVERALDRIYLSRVFTCYQMETLLSQTDFAAHPVLILDFLSTFYDQSVSAYERRRLLHACLNRLKQISRQAPVAIWARTRTVIPEDAVGFIDALRGAAGPAVAPALAEPALAWRQPALLG